MENLAIMQLIYYVKTNRDFDSEIYLFFLSEIQVINLNINLKKIPIKFFNQFYRLILILFKKKKKKKKNPKTAKTTLYNKRTS